jgi:pyruvate formate lyase activating enzyme
MSVEEVLDVVGRDDAFYRASGGGMTLSGGEPLAQAAFSEALLRAGKAAGFHTVVETAGSVPWEAVDRARLHTDLFYYDVKCIDAASHACWTGSDNHLSLDNLRRLTQLGHPVVARVPLIPGFNDGAEFERIVEFVEGLSTVSELHILPLHQLGSDKYEQVGLPYAMHAAHGPSAGSIEHGRARAEERGLRVSIGGAGFVVRDSAVDRERCRA